MEHGMLGSSKIPLPTNNCEILLSFEKTTFYSFIRGSKQTVPDVVIEPFTFFLSQMLEQRTPDSCENKEN